MISSFSLDGYVITKRKTGDEYNENGDMTMTTTLSDWETPPFATLILKSL
jgi:hypothetical protein